MGSLPPRSIPLIDLSLFTNPPSPSARVETARSLVKACHETGFVYITNCGIESSRIGEAFSWGHRFYALPDEKKSLAKHKDGSTVFRGWSCVGKEQVPEIEGEKKADVVDFTEAYGIGTDDNLEEPNVWIPESVLSGFRTFTAEFHSECWQVATQVLRALALGLGLPDEEFLLRLHQQKDNELSLRHYPPVDEETIRSGELDRLGAHTDFDSFTLLWQDKVGGLEVKDMSGKWVDVQPMEDTLVMNIGDVLQRWSNGISALLHFAVIFLSVQN
ncbi:Protein DMR6-like oxygenase [Lachnellula suecica]|uniref:Protein DMR6-like oxygenase n=1 Tax=Lachnellula suecica TaxID=602035 RepID=A0A8T9CGH1_9HELO|nr:Protein DMR6-like oxygenase [Lachnellula suecica]